MAGARRRAVLDRGGLRSRDVGEFLRACERRSVGRGLELALHEICMADVDGKAGEGDQNHDQRGQQDEHLPGFVRDSALVVPVHRFPCPSLGSHLRSPVRGSISLDSGIHSPFRAGFEPGGRI